MNIGIALPTNRIRLTGEALRDIVTALEATACRSVWVNDHLAAFPAGAEHYPYSPTGVIDWNPHSPQYEALATCGYLLGVTSRLRVGTSVLILPQRHPVEVAKAGATLASLGHFVLGVGVGWSRREMALLGWDPATRGRRMDEQLDILRALWTSAPHPALPQDLIFEPAPARPPQILVGGGSQAALRRVRQRGDGWLAVSGPSPEQLKAVGVQLAELGSQSAVLKVALDRPDAALAARVMRDTADHGWDEISFEFKTWDLDAVCELVDHAVP